MTTRKLLSAAVLCMALAASALAHAPRSQDHAVTLWWLIFNSPENCVAHPAAVERCGPLDVFGQPYLESVQAGQPDPALIMPNLASGLAVVYATGGIAGKSGRVRLAASIYRSPPAGLNLGGTNIIDPLGLGGAFSNPGAEIHLVVRDHGRQVRHDRIAQITGFLDPNCSDPALGVQGGRNVCEDIQFAVFAPGESGKDSVFAVTDGRLLSSSSAYLFRQGDALQAVVETNVRHR